VETHSFYCEKFFSKWPKSIANGKTSFENAIKALCRLDIIFGLSYNKPDSSVTALNC